MHPTCIYPSSSRYTITMNASKTNHPGIKNGKREHTQNKQMNEFNYKAEESPLRLQAFYVDENIKISKE